MANVFIVIHIPYEEIKNKAIERSKSKEEVEEPEHIVDKDKQDHVNEQDILNEEDKQSEQDIQNELENRSKPDNQDGSKEVVNENDQSQSEPVSVADSNSTNGSVSAVNGGPSQGAPVTIPSRTSTAAVENKYSSKKNLNRYLSYNLTTILVSILEKNSVKKATWQRTKDGENWEVCFPLETKLSDTLLNDLLNAGIGNNSYSSISVLPTTVNFPACLLSNDTASDKEKDQFFQSIKSRLTVAQVIDVVRNGTLFTFDYVVLILMASIIAAVGLCENSSVLLVASMLVSPLMGPILGGTFGIVLRYKPLWKPGILHEFFGLSICLFAGFLFGAICGFVPGWNVVTPEMISRGSAHSIYVGIIVAIPSGAGVALSILGGNAGSLVGVAISASLLPPAVNAGICWAFAIHATTAPVRSSAVPIALKKNIADYAPSELLEIGAISMSLTLVNIFIIFVMGVFILKIKEVAPNTGTASTRDFWKKDLKSTREMLSAQTMSSSNYPIGDIVIEEIHKRYGIDLNNKDTIKKSVESRRMAKDLVNLVSTLRKERNYTGVSSNLMGKPTELEINELISKLQPVEEEPSRFQVKKVYNLGGTTFHSNLRFTVNQLEAYGDDSEIETTSLIAVKGTTV